MISVHQNRLVGRILAAIVFLGVALLSETAFAQHSYYLYEQPERTDLRDFQLRIKADWWLASFEGSAIVDGSITPGTSIDFTDDLGVPSSTDLPCITFDYRLNKNDSIMLFYSYNKMTASQIMEEDIYFEDMKYSVADEVHTTLSVEHLDLAYRGVLYSKQLGLVTSNSFVDLGFLAGVSLTKGRIILDSPMTNKTDEAVLIPTPLIGIYAELITSSFIAEIDISTLKLGVRGMSFSYLNASASLGYNITDTFSINGGYRISSTAAEIEVGDGEDVEFYSRFTGPFASISVKF